MRCIKSSRYLINLQRIHILVRVKLPLQCISYVNRFAPLNLNTWGKFIPYHAPENFPLGIKIFFDRKTRRVHFKALCCPSFPQ